MVFPVRCFTCTKVIDIFWEKYKKDLDAGNAPQIILDRLKIGRVCCRRMFLSHVDNDDILMRYPVYKDRIQRLTFTTADMEMSKKEWNKRKMEDDS